jgi:hypothetical protein
MCPTGGGVCVVGSSVATCPAGSVVIGGGWTGESSPSPDATVGYDFPLGNNRWQVVMTNNSMLTSSFHAVAICAS